VQVQALVGVGRSRCWEGHEVLGSGREGSCRVDAGVRQRRGGAWVPATPAALRHRLHRPSDGGERSPANGRRRGRQSGHDPGRHRRDGHPAKGGSDQPQQLRSSVWGFRGLAGAHKGLRSRGRTGAGASATTPRTGYRAHTPPCLDAQSSLGPCRAPDVTLQARMVSPGKSAASPAIPAVPSGVHVSSRTSRGRRRRAAHPQAPRCQLGRAANESTEVGAFRLAEEVACCSGRRPGAAAPDSLSTASVPARQVRRRPLAVTVPHVFALEPQ
jgi:hypothetical protein